MVEKEFLSGGIEKSCRGSGKLRIGIRDVDEQAGAMTQGLSLRVSLAQFLHPVCGGAWGASTTQSKTDHRPRSERTLLGRGSFGSLLAVVPGQQLGSKLLVEARDALDGELNRAHAGRLVHTGRIGKRLIHAPASGSFPCSQR
jgi:hypothetical protein